MKAKIQKIPLTEYQIQCMVVEDLDILKAQGKIVLYTAIPSSTWTPSWSVKMRNKKMGVVAGMPDLFILGHNKILFLELKTEKGVLSKAQSVWIKELHINGFSAYVAKGYDAACEIIKQELLI